MEHVRGLGHHAPRVARIVRLGSPSCTILSKGKEMMVELRRLELGDLDAVHGLLSRMDVVRHMLLALCSREESEKFLADSLRESPSDPWRSVVRAIRDSSTGELIGLCGVVILRGAEESEIWYLVNP
jgi:hypothetical protein